ncbi:MAG: tyrosine-type recombinase/integrase [Clostridiales bacterium]|nr:tyrosine-type recombinase/integrase [Clostridiales bacterium]
MKEQSYHEQVDIKNTYKLRELIAALPPFAKNYFRGIETRTSSRTRIAYAYDLNIFFRYLHNTNPIFQKVEIKDITLEQLEQLRPMDIEEYLDYVKLYEEDGQVHTNKERGIMRKLSSLKSFYCYFYRNESIKYNPVELVQTPKFHEKAIIRLDMDEMEMLLEHVDNGEKLTEKQKVFHQRTRIRDLAIMTLLLGTGLRVSECVGLNLEDIDLKNDGIKVHRKGGKEVIVYFGDEVESALLDYLEQRNTIVAEEGHERALFLSLQKKRISVRTVENLVKKYSRTVTTMKNITPHKLRSTYGTNLYRETGDIYLVADVLGHADVNTTKKHYAAIDDDRRKKARNIVKLRKKEE